MADTKISADATVSPAAGDFAPILQGGVNKKATLGSIANLAATVVNGNSNVVITANSNVTIGVAGNAAILTVTGTGANITGTANITGNANVGNIGGATAVFTTLTGSLSTAAQTNITSVGTLTGLLVGNGTANVTIASGSNGNMTVTSNITAGNFMGILANTTSNVRIPAAAGNVNISVGAVANVLVVTTTGANIAGTANVSGNITAGNIAATNHTGTTVNVTGQIISTVATSTAPLVVTSTTLVPNLYVARANVADFDSITTATAGNYYLAMVSAITGNVAQVGNAAILANVTTGILYATKFSGDGSLLSNLSLANGNSNVTIPAAAGPIRFASNGVANVMVVSTSNVSIKSNIAWISPDSGSTLMTTKMSNTGVLTFENAGGVAFSIGADINNMVFSVNDTSGVPLMTTSNSGITTIGASGGFVAYGTSAAVTAAGTVQANATAILRPISVVNTVTSGTGVLLPASYPGLRVLIMNTSANTLKVYPPVNAAINAASANVAYSMETGLRLEFVNVSSTQWYTLHATYG